MPAEIERWLEMQNPSIQKSVAVVEVTRPLLHLSSNPTIRKFTPRIPKSLYDGEDQTVPRICVSTNLIETLIGAAWNFVDFQSQVNYDSLDFVVYGLTTDSAVRPTKKLTQEGIATGELWIVPHRMSVYEMLPTRIANLSISNVLRKGEEIYLDFVIELREEMLLTASRNLQPGYYHLGRVKLSDIVNKNRDMSFDLNTTTRDGFLNGKYNLSVSQ